MKKLLVTLLSVSILFSVFTTKAFAEETSIKTEENTEEISSNYNIKPFAWPGRPGGNGDGSEEWLGYSCKINWKYKNTTNGKVSELQAIRDAEYNIKSILLTTLIGKIKPIAGIALSLLLTNGAQKIPGDLYTSKNYISDDCVKSVITLKDFNGKKIGEYTVLSKIK